MGFLLSDLCCDVLRDRVYCALHLGMGPVHFREGDGKSLRPARHIVTVALGRSGPARQEDMQQEKETTLHVVTSCWLEAEWLLILGLTLAQASLKLTASVPVNSWPFVSFSFSRCGIISVSCHAQYPHRCYILTHMSTNN